MRIKLGGNFILMLLLTIYSVFTPFMARADGVTYNIYHYAGYPAEGQALMVGQFPRAVAVHGSYIYVADEMYMVRRIDMNTGNEIVVAGTGNVGYSGDGGPATSADLYSPCSLAVDVAGNLYIAESDYSTIRKVSATTGIITTVAGNGYGYSGDGGLAINAQLSYPCGLAVDGGSNLYFADRENCVIRKIDTAGIITTVAGTGSGGDYSGDGGPATSAVLSYPAGVAVDGAGNLYIADIYNGAIRKVNAATGKITTVAGPGDCSYSGDGGPATSAGLSSISGVAVDIAGNLYIADIVNCVIRKVNSTTGTINTWAGAGSPGYSGDGGPASSAELSGPSGVAVDNVGNLYIVDKENYVIRKVDISGIITTVAGTGSGGYSGDEGPATSAELWGSSGVAVDGAGNLYIADTGNRVIRKVDTAGIITTVAGDGSYGYSGDGGPAINAQLSEPTDVAVDGAGNFYIVDRYNGAIRKVDAAGIITTVAGTGTWGNSGDGGPATSAKLNDPCNMAVDGAGNIYISTGQTVRKVDTAGTITTVAGNGSYGYSGDGGPATSAELRVAMGLAVDGAGNLYITDCTNYAIRMVDAATGIITTVAGNGSEGYSGDGGPATSAQLSQSTGVAVDEAGNLYIADNINCRIRKVDTAGIITTVAGNGSHGYSGFVNGSPAISTALNWPQEVVVDGAGNLYILEGFQIRKAVASTHTVVHTVAKPFFSPAGETYNTQQAVNITCVTAGAEIRYTNDGSEPKASSALYDGTPILINNTGEVTLKARAFRDGWSPSEIADQTYKILGTIIKYQPGYSGSQTTINWLLTARNFENDLAVQYNTASLWLEKGKTGRLSNLWLYYPQLIGSNTGQIPADAKIVSAQLVLTVKSFKGNAYRAHKINLYQITDPDNLGAPYFGSDGLHNGLDYQYRDHRLGRDIKWKNGAANIGDLLSGSTPVDTYEAIPEVFQAEGYTQFQFDVTDSIKDWLSGDSVKPNQGWFLSGDQAKNWAFDDGIEFYGATDPTIANRPKLEVTYLSASGDNEPPDAVTELTAIPGSEQVSLIWTNPATDCNGVIVLRKAGVIPAAPTDGTVVFDGVTSTKLDNQGLANNKTYYYAVFAYDNLRNYSRKAWVKAIPTAGGGVPNAPAALNVGPTGNSLVFNWIYVSGNEKWFSLEQQGPDGSWLRVACPASGQSSLTISFDDLNFRLIPGTSYNYRLSAVNDHGASGYAIASFSTPAFLQAPANLSWQIISAGRINMAWTDQATDETGYRIDICQNDAGHTVLRSMVLPAGATSYSVTGLNPGTEYLLKVAAVRGTEEAAAWTEPLTTNADFKGGLL